MMRFLVLVLNILRRADKYMIALCTFSGSDST